MGLTSDTNQSMSMNDMRTEFGITGSISMNQLYRGGAEVPASVNTTCTVSEVQNVLCGDGYVNDRANHGNAASPCGATSRNFNHGYFRGGVTPSGSISWSIDGSVNNTFFYNSSWNSTNNPPETIVDLTFSHTATYYTYTHSYQSALGHFKVGTGTDMSNLQVNQILQGSGTDPVPRYDSFSATAGTAVRVSIQLPYNIESGVRRNIGNTVSINTGSSNSSSRALSVNSTVPDGTSGNETISFSNFYGVIGE